MTTEAPKTTYLSDYQVPEFLIDSVDLHFDLGEEVTTVKSKLVIKRNPDSNTKSHDLVLNGEQLKLIDVKIDGQSLKPSAYQVTDKLLTLYKVPNEFDLEITVENSPIKNTALCGLYVSSNNFCTQCEAEGFRRITYYLDRPGVMSRFTTTITADKKRYPILLSNGNPVASGVLEKGRHWIKWQDPFKKPSYLFALVAGDFECLEDEFTTQSGRKVALKIFVEKGNLDKTHFAMQAVKKAMRWDEKTFGREYDLDIYMIVAVSDFNMGAMENKGLNIFNTKYILASPETATDQDYINIEAVIAHEYFHNWTGNRITCRDWFQLSIKEGLTVFRDQSFTMDTTSKTVARIQDVTNLRNTQFSEDAGPLAHPVQPQCYIEISNFYTTTIYEKGAELIRMMQTILGEKQFRKAMDLYFERHDGHAVTIEDFVKTMEDSSGVDLKQFRLWYLQAGTPVLDVASEYHAGQKEYILTVKQSCPPTPGQPTKLPMHIPVSVGLLDQSGKEVAHDLLHVKEKKQQFTFDHIMENPYLSLLRGFSAPVKVNYDYSDEALLFLFQHDTDEFNRWEAGQTFAIRLILKLIDDHRNKRPLRVPEPYISTLRHIISDDQRDGLLLSEMLLLPSEKYIAEQMSVIDIDSIHMAREFVSLEIAKQLKSLLMDVYQRNHDQNAYKRFDMAEVGKRKLKNTCLSYLMLLPDKSIHEKLGMQQFKSAIGMSMTDALSALKCLSNLPDSLNQEALNEFYARWQNEALVVDKWLTIQATSTLPDTLNQVVKLTQHKAFDIKNPNKVYALVGAFCQQNLVRFHDAGGKGYQFLADKVLQLDSLNPQIAARMITPLTAWKRYDQNRQELMRSQLDRFLKIKTLSEDVYELVKKSI